MTKSKTLTIALPIILCSSWPLPFPNRTHRSRILGMSKRKLSYIISPNTAGVMKLSCGNLLLVTSRYIGRVVAHSFYTEGPTLDSLCVAILRKVKKTALWIERCMSATEEDGSVVRSKLRGAWRRYESRHFCKDSSNTTWSMRQHKCSKKTKANCYQFIYCVVVLLPDTRTYHEVTWAANQGPLWWIWHVPETPPTLQGNHLLVGAYKAQNSAPPSWPGAGFQQTVQGLLSTKLSFTRVMPTSLMSKYPCEKGQYTLSPVLAGCAPVPMGQVQSLAAPPVALEHRP